jgi:hypothetical protein
MTWKPHCFIGLCKDDGGEPKMDFGGKKMGEAQEGKCALATLVARRVSVNKIYIRAKVAHKHSMLSGVPLLSAPQNAPYTGPMVTRNSEILDV